MDLYITNDRIGIESGGGWVTKNERDALAEQSEIIWMDWGILGPLASKIPNGVFAPDISCASSVLDLLDTYKFDIAHFYSGSFPSTVDLLRRSGTKVTYTVAAHDPEISREEHLKLGMDFEYPHLKDQKLFRYYTECFRQSDVVVCPSKKSARIMESFGCKKTIVINHGIMNPSVQFSPYPKDFRVGYLGQMGPDKGLMYLMMATKATGHQLVVGGNQFELGIEIWRKFGGGSTDFKGFVRSPSDLYNECTVYCQPSATEAWGIEVLEAMAHGRAVICSEGAGASESITDGVDGFIVPPRDSEAIADRLRYLQKNLDIAATMGQKAMRTAFNFGWQNIRKQYIDMWRQVREGTL